MRKPILLYWFFLCFFTTQLAGQCLEITANEQLKICSSEQGLLSATTNGTVLFSEWTPTKGLNNPLSLNSLITEPFDTTYTLRVKGFLESENLLTNSDFSEGDVGFTSQYEPESTKPEGYIIGTIGTELFAEAKECEDHSTPEAGGNMMMVRVSESSNVEIYCQEIKVKSNQDYHFRGFATGLKLNDPPIIVLKINGEIISIGTLGSFACSWQQIAGDWNAGSTNTAKVCIFVSPEDIGAGTDFVLDDIGFYEVCEIEKKVVVEVLDFEVTIAEAIGLTCGDSLGLSATVIPEDLNFTTEWATIDGHFVNGETSLFPIIDAVGTYELSVRTTIDEQACSANKTVEVYTISEDTLTIFKSENLHCNQKKISLSAVDAVNQTEFSYQWKSTDGHILSDVTNTTIQVDQPGLYELQRRNLDGTCPQTAEMRVAETSLEDFTYEVMIPNCETATGTILFNEITGGEAPFYYSIDSGQTFLANRVFPDLSGGTYDLIIQDANECEISKRTSFTSFIGVQLDLPNSIRVKTTDNYQLPLQINLVGSLIENIEWTPAIGLSCSDCIQPFLTSSKSQIYKVIVEDSNACIAQASIQIEVTEPSDVYIPSVFSPNKDGQNDIFQIHANSQQVKKITRFHIFDRYGNLVFSQRDFLPNTGEHGWNGYYKNEAMPIGIYVYSVEVELADGQLALFSGEVGLVK